MTRPGYPSLPTAAVGPLGGGDLTGRAVRPVRPVLSLSACPVWSVAQPFGQRAQMVWVMKPSAIGKSEAFAGILRHPFQMGGHPVAQGAAQSQHMGFIPFLRPGHCLPPLLSRHFGEYCA